MTVGYSTRRVSLITVKFVMVTTKQLKLDQFSNDGAARRKVAKLQRVVPFVANGARVTGQETSQQIDHEEISRWC